MRKALVVMQQRERGRGLLVAAVTAMVAVCGAAATSRAEAAPPIVAADPAHPSDIAFADGSTYETSFQGILMDVVCVAFVNNGAKTATKVGLNLAYVAADGTVLGVDSLYPPGSFPVAKRSAFSGVRGATPVSNGNCHPTFAVQRTSSSTFQYRLGRDAPPTDVATVLVSAREIVYVDGTAWRTDDVPHAGDHVRPPVPPPFNAAVPSGPPLITAMSAPGSPVTVDDAIRFGGEARYPAVCVVFTDRDARTAKRVVVAHLLVDRTGTVADVKFGYNTGTFSTGVTIDNSRGACTAIEGGADGDSFLYRTMDRSGEAVPIGRIVVVPFSVDFADGTSWQAPGVPKPGERLTH
ncbi:MAG: hypothetical protein JWN27_486 [Candidatus Eremiobacteraeota bacterium]|nr:hypothetical protein [Candidatus Eremiobacteraeota bacterium]